MDQKIEKLYKSSLKLLGSLSLNDTYSIIVHEAMKLARADAGSILLEEKGVLKRVYSSNPSFFKIQPRKRGHMYSVYQKLTPKILSQSQILKAHPEAERINVRSDLIIPLSYEKKRLGVLSVISKKNKVFAEYDLSILKLFGPLASLAIIKSQLYQEIQNSLDARNLFISIASHELKTPLTTLSMYSELIKKHFDEKKELRPEWIQLIHDETKWMNILFNELLQMEQINGGKFTYNWKMNNISNLIKRIKTHFQVQFQNHHLVIEKNISSKDTLYSDFDKLLQVFTNILGNAGKFSEPHQPVFFSVTKNQHEYVFEIKDKGIGINKKDLPNIYKDFYKGKNNNSKGMGLGLFIVKEIINSHDGTIKIRSKPKIGTQVTITIPTKKI